MLADACDDEMSCTLRPGEIVGETMPPVGLAGNPCRRWLRVASAEHGTAWAEDRLMEQVRSTRSPRKGATVDVHRHTMSDLFAQLGLPADPTAIDDFVAAHRPLESNVALYRAPFWTSSQRSFLKEEIIDDADWAVVIDELNARLS